MGAAVRHLLSVAALAILPLTGAAQTQNAPSQQPGTVSLPSAPMFMGGFSRPIFQGGFAHPIYPGGFGRSTPLRVPQPVGGPTLQSKPEGVDQVAPPPADAAAVSRPRTDEHDHDNCTGACADEHAEHGHSVDKPAAVPVQETSPSPRDQLLAKLKPEFNEEAFKRANRPEAGAAPSCVKCHSDKSKFVKRNDQAPKPTLNDLRLLGRLNDTHIINAVDHSHPTAHPPARPPEVQPDPQVAQAAMISAAPAAAADSFRDHLKTQPDDFHAMRLYALALLSSKHPQEAADAMAKAYESDPLLAKEPIDLKAAGFEGARVAALVKAAEDAARQSKSSAGWLLAAVLHQAKGSQAQAFAALDSSRRLGLNADVADWLTAQLKKSPERVVQAGSK
jgi:hypothetical protein